MPNDDMLAHYSAALDEIYRLRTALAYEAQVAQVHLDYATFPKSRRKHAEAQVERMMQAATGKAEQAYADTSPASLKHVRRESGIPDTLTRFEWEARELSPSEQRYLMFLRNTKSA